VAPVTSPSATSAPPTSQPVRPPRPVLEALVRALATPGVGNAAIRAAMGATTAAATPGVALTSAAPTGAATGTAPGNLAAALDRLARRAGGSLRPAELERAEGWARTALRTIDRGRVHVLTPEMELYPEPLRQLNDPPSAVFAAGRLDLLTTPMVAIVGTRSCTERGRAAARRMARGLATAGVTVISGLALGIDGESHRAAGPAGTIGVLGCGLDVAYPPSHRPLQRAIAREGLLLSEVLLGAPPAPHHFPRRNRLIAALGLGVVVVEAPQKSGALITVRHALDLGRTVFAMPGFRGSPASAGTNQIIEEGATLVTTPREVLEALDLPSSSLEDDDGVQAPPAGLHGVGLAVWRSLRAEPRHVDDLAAELGLEPQNSLASLLALEIQGHARQLAGLRFVRV
jgi:DNA processing protein